MSDILDNEEVQKQKSSNFWKYYLGSILFGIIFLFSLPGSYSPQGYSGGVDPFVLIVIFIAIMVITPLIALIVGWRKKNRSLINQAGFFVILYAFFALLFFL